MPGFDGAQLLDVVARRWPATCRIALSGHSALESVVRGGLAQYYLSKPCDPRSLRAIFTHHLGGAS